MKKEYVNNIKGFEGVVRLDESAYGMQQSADIARVVKSLSEDARVIDIGCGFGIASSQLAEHFENVSACDIPSYVTQDVELQEKIMAARNIDFKWSTPGKLPYEDNTFDGILLYAVIEHVPDKETFLKECNRILKPNGRIFMFRAVIDVAFAEKLAKLMGIVNHGKDVVNLPQMRDVIEKCDFKLDKWGYQGWLPEKNLPKYLIYLCNHILIHIPFINKFSHDYYFICTKR